MIAFGTKVDMPGSFFDWMDFMKAIDKLLSVYKAKMQGIDGVHCINMWRSEIRSFIGAGRDEFIWNGNNDSRIPVSDCGKIISTENSQILLDN